MTGQRYTAEVGARAAEWPGRLVEINMISKQNSKLHSTASTHRRF